MGCDDKIGLFKWLSTLAPVVALLSSVRTEAIPPRSGHFSPPIFSHGTCTARHGIRTKTKITRTC